LGNILAAEPPSQDVPFSSRDGGFAAKIIPELEQVFWVGQSSGFYDGPEGSHM